MTPAEHAATVRECLLRRGAGDYERTALDSLAALVAQAKRAAELEKFLSVAKDPSLFDYDKVGEDAQRRFLAALDALGEP